MLEQQCRSVTAWGATATAGAEGSRKSTQRQVSRVTDPYSQEPRGVSTDPQSAAGLGHQRASRGNLREGAHSGERTTEGGGQLRGAFPSLSLLSANAPKPREGWREERSCELE